MKLGNERGLSLPAGCSETVDSVKSVKPGKLRTDGREVTHRESHTLDDRQAGPTLGFLTVLHDAAGYTGGYLVVNAWGRPLEFRLTTPVQPNRVQEILYGATLGDYIHADLIGRTLVEKTAAVATLIVTDTPAVLSLGSRIDVPVVAVGESVKVFEHPRSSQPLSTLTSENAVIAILDKVDAAVDLAEPFARIRDAVREARATGASRAA